ncbi:hypothetical protein U9M48_020585 [Paspalum notatum var. saurae]|uniref:Uncharacterized protein n=1 Tax=Paspalum notatum var. saurae TaxID=547442 RepID=A0AAQ3THR4_PASNO
MYHHHKKSKGKEASCGIMQAFRLLPLGEKFHLPLLLSKSWVPAFVHCSLCSGPPSVLTASLVERLLRTLSSPTAAAALSKHPSGSCLMQVFAMALEHYGICTTVWQKWKERLQAPSLCFKDVLTLEFLSICIPG